MNLNQFIQTITTGDIFDLFFKTFAVVFSLLYIIYALVIYKQTQVMTKTLETEGKTFILLISLIQIGIGIVLLFFALLLI